MRSKILSFALLFLMIVSSALWSEQAALILNMENQEVLPKNFRMSSDPLRIKLGVNPSPKGLRDLRISGSAQFSEKSLQEIVKKVGCSGKFIIVDLRQESHGFVDGIAISWYSARD